MPESMLPRIAGKGRVADRAVQIFGGAGYVSEYAIERFYRERVSSY
jgi:alkylation response protein AidB-like acyl-CoA dehydrogenase